jgi:hypothetical protein
VGDDVERVRAIVGRHVAHWKSLRLFDYLGGPFEDRSGGLITFGARNLTEEERVVGEDPVMSERLLEAHWLKKWVPE